jgi:hypothetical protein
VSDLQLSMATSSTKKTIEALNKKILKGAESAVKKATTEVAIRTTAEMKGLIDKKRAYTGRGKSKRYAKGNPPEPPQNRTGALRRSIRFKVRKGYGGKYIATVAPYMIYARRLEFGGGNWPAGTRYPFVEPTAKIMRANNLARSIYVKALRAEYNK